MTDTKLVIGTDFKFFNRDLSWLKFNERVLNLAQDHRVPLLERLRFLSIFSTNLDEFFMKRISSLRGQSEKPIADIGPQPLTGQQLFSEIRATVVRHGELMRQTYEKLLPELEKQKIFFLKWQELTDVEKKWAGEYFTNKVFPILTPLAVDKSHPFPFLSNLSVSLGIVLKRPKTFEQLFARVKIPEVLPQWVQIHSSGERGYRLIRLIDLIAANLSELFPEMLIEHVMPFRVTRNADVGDMSDDVEDRFDTVEEELRLRRVAQIVRLEHGPVADRTMLHYLRDELKLTNDDLYENCGEISYHSLSEVANLNIASLRYAPCVPVRPSVYRDDDRDVFSAIRDRDILVHYPYESFPDSVERFVREAVNDPAVLAIKITLYRAGENNPIIPMLITAAQKGKQVVCILELKARFDEARNMYWGEMLEDAGVHVIYGVEDKKVHSKIMLIIRKEGENYRFYSHISSGNYNPNTAKLYTDLSLFTADKRIGTEVIEVFNYLTGLSLKKNYQKLLVAPINMRKRFLQLIKKEIEFQKTGEGGYILAKMNSFEDREVCDALYEASQAGVKIDLIVRGLCTLRPHVPGLSENIRVFSVVGRFLEHSRIYYFKRGSKDPIDGKFMIGSADWMYRNLNNRIEAVVPIDEAACKQYLWQVLQMILNDRVQTWELEPNGEYTLRKPETSGERGVQEELGRLHGSLVIADKSTR